MSRKFRYQGKRYSMQGFATGEHASVYKGMSAPHRLRYSRWYNKKVTAYNRRKKI